MTSRSVRIFSLGGLGEVGMNCLALEQRGEVLIVDCGVTFDDRGLGVDVVHPDFTALDAYRDRLAGVFLTHGHEDHIGALPYLLRRFDVPVYGPPYALGLVRERAREHEILDHVRFHETRPREKYKVGSFIVEPIRVTHSIADATSLAIKTDAGMIIHTGDFKFDETPPDGEEFDEERFIELGLEGVEVLLSDSTNIDSAGTTGSEKGVGETLQKLVEEAKGAVFVALFASNAHRLKMLGDIAVKTRRRLVFLGRGVVNHSRVGKDTGYLDFPSGIIYGSERMRELPRDKILAVCTGSQGEPNAALSRLARGDHPAFQLDASDTVILSSRVIPGNEKPVMAIMANILRRGIALHSWHSDRKVHVSGHAHREEQRRMLENVRPKAFIPLHGTLHHLTRHAELARECGVETTCVMENGNVAVLDEHGLRRDGKVHSGRVHIWNQRPIPQSVLKERMSMAAEGVAFVVVETSNRGIPTGHVTLETRGLVDETADAPLVATARNEVITALEELGRGLTDASLISETARLAVRRSFQKSLGWKPTTVVSLIRRP